MIEDDEENFVNQESGKENDVKDESMDVAKAPTSPKRAKSPKSNSPKRRSPSPKKSPVSTEEVIEADKNEHQSSSDDGKAVDEDILAPVTLKRHSKTFHPLHRFRKTRRRRSSCWMENIFLTP